MAKPNGVVSSKARNYSEYRAGIFEEGMKGKHPYVTTNPNKLEEQAKSALGDTAYGFVAGGAGEKATMAANRLVFRQWKIIPRMLKSSMNHDLRTELFGAKVDSPIYMAPIGVQQLFHADKEYATAAVAREVGAVYVHSTASSVSLEDAATASGDGLRFFQLYWPVNHELTLSILKRVKQAGYKVLVVTLDTWHMGWRPDDLDAGFMPFKKGIGIQTISNDPVFRRLFAETHGGKTPEDDVPAAGTFWISQIMPGKARTWDDVKLLRDNWAGPMVLKGIQHVEDARMAVEHGMDGICVSNHGGRQLDGAIGSLDALEAIAKEVGDKVTILFDSGVRTGADVIKALCLGAHSVGVGRPYIYGLGINGKEGCKTAMQNILADLDSSLGLAGLSSIKECTRDMIQRTNYPGDTIASL